MERRCWKVYVWLYDWVPVDEFILFARESGAVEQINSIEYFFVQFRWDPAPKHVLEDHLRKHYLESEESFLAFVENNSLVEEPM